MKKTKNSFNYGKLEMDYLSKKDSKIGDLIKKIGKIDREVNPDIFAALIESVVSQQISSKAADTVIKRIYAVLEGEMNAEKIKKIGYDSIRSCGMSDRKTGYIIGIAETALEGGINFENLNNLSDGEVITQLSSLHGVGVWTAEMLLIFSMNRHNVLSYGDLAIKRGIMKLHGLETISKKEFEHYRELYSPYCSVASLYLWEHSK